MKSCEKSPVLLKFAALRSPLLWQWWMGRSSLPQYRPPMWTQLSQVRTGAKACFPRPCPSVWQYRSILVQRRQCRTVCSAIKSACGAALAAMAASLHSHLRHFPHRLTLYQEGQSGGYSALGTEARRAETLAAPFTTARSSPEEAPLSWLTPPLPEYARRAGATCAARPRPSHAGDGGCDPRSRSSAPASPQSHPSILPGRVWS